MLTQVGYFVENGKYFPVFNIIAGKKDLQSHLLLQEQNSFHLRLKLAGQQTSPLIRRNCSLLKTTKTPGQFDITVSQHVNSLGHSTDDMTMVGLLNAPLDSRKRKVLEKESFLN